MSKPRELFVPIPIKAWSGNHALLKDNEVPVIGYITDRKRFTPSGYCAFPRMVCLHYGTEHPDFFYFENMELVFMSVSIKTPEYITDIYSECARQSVSSDEFIERVVCAYVVKELGF
jgi:hypothetical protein